MATAKKATAKKATAKKTTAKKATAKKRPTLKKGPGGVVLLSGGNPQIPKGEGRAPVQAYLDAVPGWKHDVGVALDAVIMRTVPDAHLWVKWNSPFYGADDETWFASLHCLTKAVRVTFCRGASLDPQPAVGSKYPDVRYHDVGEHDDIDEATFASWIAQARALPGDRF
jgi:hypothetical protein